jgi:hypothetical protein
MRPKSWRNNWAEVPKCRLGPMTAGQRGTNGKARADIDRIAPITPLPARPVWLTAAKVPRIRRVFDHLARGFKPLPLDPCPAFG